MPKVSVCIPTYNSAHSLGCAIQSVLNQSFEDFELVISDNASMDNTEALVNSYHDKRIKYICNNENIGMYPNFNKCIEASNGQYIKFLCSDDWFQPNLLEAFIAVINDEPKVGLVVCTQKWVNAKGEFIRYAKRFPQNKIMKGEEAFRDFLLRGNGGASPSSVMVKRECFEQVGIFKNINQCGWGNDWEMWLRILSKYEFAYLAEPLVYIRRHEDSGTTSICDQDLDIQSDYKALEYVFQNAEDVYFPIDRRTKRRALMRIGQRAFSRSVQYTRQGNIGKALQLLKTVHENGLLIWNIFYYIQRVLKTKFAL